MTFPEPPRPEGQQSQQWQRPQPQQQPYPPQPAPTYLPPQFNRYLPQPAAAASRPQNVLGIVALVAAAIGVALIFVADSTPVISASGPAVFAVLLGLAGIILGAVGWSQGNRKGMSIVLAVIGLVIGGFVLVGGIAEYVAIQHQLDVARQCLSDLIACGQQQ